MTVEDHHEKSPSDDEIQEARLLTPREVLPEQGFAEVTYVEEDSPQEEVEEAVPLVYASTSPNEEMIHQESDVVGNNDSIGVGDRFLSQLRLTDDPQQQ